MHNAFQQACPNAEAANLAAEPVMRRVMMPMMAKLKLRSNLVQESADVSPCDAAEKYLQDAIEESAQCGDRGEDGELVLVHPDDPQGCPAREGCVGTCGCISSWKIIAGMEQVVDAGCLSGDAEASMRARIATMQSREDEQCTTRESPCKAVSRLLAAGGCADGFELLDVMQQAEIAGCPNADGYAAKRETLFQECVASSPCVAAAKQQEELQTEAVKCFGETEDEMGCMCKIWPRFRNISLQTFDAGCWDFDENEKARAQLMHNAFQQACPNAEAANLAAEPVMRRVMMPMMAKLKLRSNLVQESADVSPCDAAEKYLQDAIEESAQCGDRGEDGELVLVHPDDPQGCPAREGCVGTCGCISSWKIIAGMEQVVDAGCLSGDAEASMRARIATMQSREDEQCTTRESPCKAVSRLLAAGDCADGFELLDVMQQAENAPCPNADGYAAKRETLFRECVASSPCVAAAKQQEELQTEAVKCFGETEDEMGCMCKI